MTVASISRRAIDTLDGNAGTASQGNQRASAISVASGCKSPPAYSAVNAIISECGNAHDWLAKYASPATSTPTSSRTSRWMQSSIVSPGSTKPASALHIPGGKRCARASSISRPRVTSTIIAGDTRGYAIWPQAGHSFARSPGLSRVGVPQRPQYRCVASQSTIWNARAASARCASGSAKNSDRSPA